MKIADNHINNRVCTDFDIDSEIFKNVRYRIKDGSLIIMTAKHGILCLDLKNAIDLGKEIKRLGEEYKNFNYKRYVLFGERKE